MAEPITASVLARLDDIQAEVKTASLETRAALAELRNDIQDVRVTGLEIRLNVAELRGKLDTMFDFLADFRREYKDHTHTDDV